MLAEGGAVHSSPACESVSGIEDLVVDVQLVGLSPYALPVVVLALVLWDGEVDGLDVASLGSSI